MRPLLFSAALALAASLAGPLAAEPPANLRQPRVSPALAPDARIRRLISDELGVELGKVTDRALLGKDLGADDLDLVELQLRLEDEFGVTISDEATEKFTTVGSVIKFLRVALAAKAPAPPVPKPPAATPSPAPAARP